MHRTIVSILLVSEPSYNEQALKYFLLNLNKIQSYYEFTFPLLKNYYFNNDVYENKILFDVFSKEINKEIETEKTPDYFINIITKRFKENLFFACKGNVAFITTNKWDKHFSPPSLFEYLLHSIIASLLLMNKKLNLNSHDDTKGCCLDYTFYKMDDKVDISLGYICDSCKRKILKGESKEYLKEIEDILSRKWIGNVEEFESVSHSLKKYFHFDINKDSGFNKGFWESTKEKITVEIIKIIVGSIIALLIALLLAFFLYKLGLKGS